MACNQMQQAMNAFEAALADKTYFLSDSASVDYGRAAQAVATGTAAMQPIVVPEPENDMSGLDVAADGAPLRSGRVLRLRFLCCRSAVLSRRCLRL